MGKICANVECGVVFEANVWNKKYCNKQCSVHVYNRSEQRKISTRNYSSSEKGKASNHRCNVSEKGKAAVLRYRQSERGKAILKAYYQSDKVKIMQRAYIQSTKGREIQRAASAKHRDLYPIKVKARQIANRAFKTIQPCSIANCNKQGEKHHQDYNKPLEIIWLCSYHHKQDCIK
jgi:hypothetical protein